MYVYVIFAILSLVAIVAFPFLLSACMKRIHNQKSTLFYCILQSVCGVIVWLWIIVTLSHG